MIQLLGLLDLLAALLVLYSIFLPQKLLFIAAWYLIFKGVFFSIATIDFLSIGDVLAGAYLLLLAFGLASPAFSAAIAIFLLYKGVMSFL
ncbi:hypothetical protein D6745_01500 [Candidatus Woesearchaeota archaeon]|nr:MAG: hypothetical protein D6745_01500 [Candidatus Woesearchaeota archaeon]